MQNCASYITSTIVLLAYFYAMFMNQNSPMLKAIDVKREDIVKVMLIKGVEVDMESLRKAVTEGNE